jgi:ribosome-interacting GTPase 1
MAKTQKNKATSFHLGMTANRTAHVDILIYGQDN